MSRATVMQPRRSGSIPDIGPAVERILAGRRSLSREGSLLVAVSGIDGCGKGYVSAQIARALRSLGLREAVLNVDGWLCLPSQRFGTREPAAHFYEKAIRFEEMFARLVLPLRDRGSIRLEADYTEEASTTYRPHLYEYQDLDVIVLEGIFLLKRELRAHYDLAVWIECSFETALERAVARAQEGLPPLETEQVYRRIYFPAQEIHFRRDEPRAWASLVIPNDPRCLAGARLEAEPGR